MSVEKAFEVPSIVINDLGGILSGTADPSTPGLNAPIGSLYMRDNGGVGEHWKKTGSLDTDWVIETSGGGGVSVAAKWQYDDTTTQADPGAGNFRLNNLTIASATRLYISEETKDGADFSVVLNALDIGDRIYLQNIEDSTERLMLNITAKTDNGTWFDFTFTVDDSNGPTWTDGKEFSVLLLGSVVEGGGGGTGDSTQESFNQVTHAFVVGDVLRYDTAVWVKAQADTEANSEAQGIVSEVTDVDNFIITYSGRIAGLSGLTPDSVYFLSDVTAGLLTLTEPAILSKPMLFTTSATEGLVYSYRTVNVGTGQLVDHADYYATGVTTITSSALTVGLDVNRQQSSGFTRSGGEVTCNTPGDYVINYDLVLDDTESSPAVIEAWLEKNTVEIPGTRGRIYHDDPQEEGSTSGLIIESLVATDVIRLRAIRISGSPDIDSHANGVRLSLFSFGTNGPEGAQGAQGIAGSGSSIAVEDEGVSVPNTPHTVLNFKGTSVVVTDAGGGQADIDISTALAITQSTFVGISTTTSLTDVVVPGMVQTPGAGDYIVEFSSSWKNSDAEDMFASIFVNNVQVAHSERITRMESSTPDTELQVHTQAYVTGVLGAQDIDIRWRTTGGTASLINRSMILTKVA